MEHDRLRGARLLSLSLSELGRVLRDELESFIPSPVPDWYVFSATSMGTRQIGYDCCAPVDVSRRRA